MPEIMALLLTFYELGMPVKLYCPWCCLFSVHGWEAFPWLQGQGLQDTSTFSCGVVEGA